MPMRTAYEKMVEAKAEYAHANGDGFGDYDWTGANDYAAEGYSLAEAAIDMPAEDRDDWIETESYAFPASAQYLVAVAADYRLAELAQAERRAA